MNEGKARVSAPVWDRKTYRRGPNRENAQGREETFWVILTSEAGFYRSRSLSKEKTGKRWSVAGSLTGWDLEKGVCFGAYVVDDDWLVC